MEFHDLAVQYKALKAEIDAQIANVIGQGHFILGEQVAELEHKLAADTGRPFCVSCANGTDALVLMLMLWGVGTGDAVFVPDFTYFSSASCTATVGATPLPVDIDLATFNMCPDALEAAIQKTIAEGKLRPRVIIAVDLFGLPADYPRIQSIAKKYNLLVLEDAAQGYGGRIGERHACTFGDAAITSFFPAKPLGCYGDGGAIFVDSAEENALLRSLRANGRGVADKYDNQRFGMNSRLDTLQAGILLPKLSAFNRYELAQLQAIADRYTTVLAGHVVTPTIPVGYRSCWAQYTILLKDRAQRDRIQSELSTQGIPTMVYYPRGIHQQTAFAHRHFDDTLYPNSLAATNLVLALPMHPYLTEEDTIRTCDALLSLLNN